MKLILSSSTVKSLCFTHAVKRAMKGESIKSSFENVNIHNNGGSCVDCFSDKLKACRFGTFNNKSLNFNKKTNVLENVCFLCKKSEKSFNRTKYSVDGKVHDFCSPCYAKVKSKDENEKNNIQEDTLHYLKSLQLKDKNKNNDT